MLKDSEAKIMMNRPWHKVPRLRRMRLWEIASSLVLALRCGSGLHVPPSWNIRFNPF